MKTWLSKSIAKSAAQNVAIGVLALVGATMAPAVASSASQDNLARQKMPADADAVGEAVVKGIDKNKAQVMLQHGLLSNGMAPMLMTFDVKERRWLEQLQVGQRIFFAANQGQNSGDMLLLWFKPMP